jgi:protein TonB
MVPAPDVEPEFQPLPLPATGMVPPQPEPLAAPAEPAFGFTPPELPEPESFPFDPKATRIAAPEPEEAVALKNVAEAPEKPKESKKSKETKKKPEKPKKKETQKAAAPAETPVPVPAPAATTQSAAAPAKSAPAAAAEPAPSPARAVASDAPMRVTNPSLVGCPLKYPERARKRNQQGTVSLRFWIGTDGKASGIEVVESSGHRILDEAAQDIIAGCKFQPLMRGNHAVRALADQTMPFQLN